ncbi:MAG TPA: hypothetical protein VGW10_06720 [Solirubrobacteraceae bacterium]|nr:hypothetical protein [Solirubrobacteraceae bacterium]
MPFVHVRSLPIAGDFDPAAALPAISRAFSHDTGIDEERVTVTWEMIAPHHYAHAGATATEQADDSHPVLVDVLAPDFHPAERIEAMLRSVAASVASAAGVGATNVFVAFSAARSGHVFDDGDVVRW